MMIQLTMHGLLLPPVSHERRATYKSIIDSIQAKSDLQTVSEKRVRKGLEDAVGYDLTPQKVCLSFGEPLTPPAYTTCLAYPIITPITCANFL